MEEIKTGGSAFPFHMQVRYKDGINSELDYCGMTLRDYFAGQALVIVLDQIGFDFERVSERAYAIADALIRERSRLK